jgi:hypothetical protein
LGYQASVFLESGYLEKANAVSMEANRLGRLAHSPHSQVRAELWHCLIATLHGNWATADEHVSKAVELAQFIDEELAETIPWNRNHAAFLRGLIPPKAIEWVIDRVPGRPEFSLFLVISQIQAGLPERAHATIESRFPGGVDDLPWDRRWLPLAAHFGIACARIGNREHCADIYDKLLPYNGRHLLFGSRGSASYFGSVEWSLGLLAAALSKWTAAEDHLVNAIRVFREMTARPFLAFALCDHAEMLRRQGRARDQSRLQGLLDESTALSANLEMESLQRRAEALR